MLGEVQNVSGGGVQLLVRCLDVLQGLGNDRVGQILFVHAGAPLAQQAGGVVQAALEGAGVLDALVKLLQPGVVLGQCGLRAGLIVPVVGNRPVVVADLHQRHQHQRHQTEHQKNDPAVARENLLAYGPTLLFLFLTHVASPIFIIKIGC